MVNIIGNQIKILKYKKTCDLPKVKKKPDKIWNKNTILSMGIFNLINIFTRLWDEWTNIPFFYFAGSFIINY